MANIIFRVTDSPEIPDASYVKNAQLTNPEIDGNFFAINTELATKAPIDNPHFTGTAVFEGSTGVKIPVGNSSNRPENPETGMIRYNEDLNSFEGYKDGMWGTIGGGASGGVSDQVFYENDQVVHYDYEITTGRNAMATGPITLDTGVKVTVPSGSRLVIL